MAKSAPLWSVFLVPVLLAAGALATTAFDAILDARGDGREVRVLTSASAPLREAARLLVQQRRTTLAPDLLLWRLGVMTVPLAAVLAALVIPLGSQSVSDLDVGVVWFNAMEVLLWAAVWLAGWGPNAPFALVGGYRFVAQGLAYELPHMFALITAALGAQSLRISDIVAAQSHLWFVVVMPAAFLIYLVSALAMAFWGPFDAPIGRDISGGPAGELAGVDRLFFLGGRWLMLVVSAALAVPLFLGGGQGALLPGWAWTLIKTGAILALLVWLRRRLPTLRMDRFSELAWVVLVPLAIVQALVVALIVINR